MTILKKTGAVCALLISMLFLANDAFATHFRYGTITTRVPNPAAQPRNVEITVELAFRWSFFGNPALNTFVTSNLDQIRVGTPIGGASFFNMNLLVLQINPTEDWFVGRAVINYVVPQNAAGDYTVLFTGCCRLSTLADNNRDTSYRIEHKFKADALGAVANNGPILTGFPIRTLGFGTAIQFDLPGVDPDGDPLTWRLATAPESLLNSIQPKLAGAVQNDPSFTVTPQGHVSWTPTRNNCNAFPVPPAGQLPTTCLHAVQFIATDGRGAVVPLDFIMESVIPSGAPPTIKIDGSAVPVARRMAIGVTSTMKVDAVDMDSASIELKGTTLPPGSSTAPSLPMVQARFGNNASASTVFTWQPELGDLGSSVIEFAANDGDGNERTNFVSVDVFQPELMYLTGYLRDFGPADAGFNRADGDNAIQLVMANIGADRKPVFNTAVAGASTTIPGGAGFANFFNKSPYEVLSFTMNNGFSADTNVFNFTATDFRGGDRYFTYEAHTYFTYFPGQVLKYKSSDDLWVFINGKLAVDLGGVHTTAREFTLNVDARAQQLGLVAGGTYEMDVFYAHRGNHVPSLSFDLPEPAVCTAVGALEPQTVPTVLGTAQTVGAVTRLSTANGQAGPTSGQAWTAAQVPILAGFTAEFDFKIAPAVAGGGEGLAFVLQSNSAVARGADAGNLGYAGIPNSIAFEFDPKQDVALADPNPMFDHVSIHTRLNQANSASEVDSIGRSGNTPDPARNIPFDLNNNQPHHARVEYQPGPGNSTPGSPNFGWLRVFLDDSMVPTLEAQVSQQQIEQAFPSGFAYMGFTAGANSSPNTTATVEISNFKLALQAVNPSISSVQAPAVILPDTTGFATLRLRDLCNTLIRNGGHLSRIAATMTAGTYSTPVSITDNSDGTYTLSFTPRVGGNWILNVTIDGIAVLNNPTIVQVMPATPTLSAAGGTFDYNGMPRTATGAATGVFGEALGGLTFTYNGAPAAIDAGDYDVVGSYAGNAHYKAATTDADLTILRIAPTVTVGNTTVIYNAQAQTATGVVKGLGGVVLDTPTFAYTPASPVDVGTYAVVGSYAGSTNYTPATANGSLTIDPATPTVTVTDVSTTFDGQPHPASAVVTGVNGVVLGPATLRYDGSLAPPVNAGSYVVAATVDAAGNYTGASGSGLVSIAKATPTVEVSSASFTYDATSHTVAATVKGVNNTVIGVPDTITYGGSAAPPSNAGTYAVVATFAETANYVAANGSGTLTIDPATPIVVVNNASHVYDGAAHASTGSVTGVGGEVLGPLSFTYDGDSASPIDVKNYQVVASFPGGGNYTDATGAGTLAITPATPTVVVNSASFVYDGQPHVVTGTVLGVGEEQLGSLSFTYDGNAASPVDAKLYQVVATFAASGNYAGATGAGTLEITRATPIVSVTGGAFTYDGQPHAASASVTGVGGVSLGGASTITYNGSVASPRDAASYAVVASFNATTNYESATGNGTIVIDRAPLVITAADKTMEEGSTVPALTASYAGFVNGETAAVLDTPVSLSTTATSSSPVGSYPITAAGAADANYDISFAAGVMTVTPRPEITPGLMVGHGFVRDDDNRYDFDFTVRERANGSDRGRLELKIKDEDRQGKKKKGAKNRDDRFVSRQLTKVFFSDDPTSRPGKSRKPQVDTVLFEGTGEWNGRGGYRFAAFAQDLGEPGRHRETIRITVFDSNGVVVAHVEGDLDGGNIQSARIRH